MKIFVMKKSFIGMMVLTIGILFSGCSSKNYTPKQVDESIDFTFKSHKEYCSSKENIRRGKSYSDDAPEKKYLRKWFTIECKNIYTKGDAPEKILPILNYSGNVQRDKIDNYIKRKYKITESFFFETHYPNQQKPSYWSVYYTGDGYSKFLIRMNRSFLSIKSINPFGVDLGDYENGIPASKVAEYRAADKRRILAENKRVNENTRREERRRQQATQTSPSSSGMNDFKSFVGYFNESLNEQVQIQKRASQRAYKRKQNLLKPTYKNTLKSNNYSSATSQSASKDPHRCGLTFPSNEMWCPRYCMEKFGTVYPDSCYDDCSQNAYNDFRVSKGCPRIEYKPPSSRPSRVTRE